MQTNYSLKRTGPLLGVAARARSYSAPASLGMRHSAAAQCGRHTVGE